jgi:hypothetical protein
MVALASVLWHGASPCPDVYMGCDGATLMDESQAPVVAAVITASAVSLVGIGTVWQKWFTDQRDAWWKRAQWRSTRASARTRSSG